MSVYLPPNAPHETKCDDILNNAVVWSRVGDAQVCVGPVGWLNWFGKHSSDVWNLAPLCVMWSLWRERNNRTFENVKHSVGWLIEFCMCSLFDWSRTWGFTTSTLVVGSIESLSCIHNM
jgi:hypothetical protein